MKSFIFTVQRVHIVNWASILVLYEESGLCPAVGCYRLNRDRGLTSCCDYSVNICNKKELYIIIFNNNLSQAYTDKVQVVLSSGADSDDNLML